MWSLGVMAFELLTGEPALPLHHGKDHVRTCPIPSFAYFTVHSAVYINGQPFAWALLMACCRPSWYIQHKRVVFDDPTWSWDLSIRKYHDKNQQNQFFISISGSYTAVLCGVQVMDQLEGLGGKELPWEGTSLTAQRRRCLGVFKASIVMLLSRDPSKRPSMSQFCDSCDRARWQHYCASPTSTAPTSSYRQSVSISAYDAGATTTCTCCTWTHSAGS